MNGQQQHSLMNINSSTMSGASSQRSMMAQRTSPSMAQSKSVYQMQQGSSLTSVTHFQLQQQQQSPPQTVQQQQQQMVSNMSSYGASSSQRQNSPETLMSHQYTSSIGMPTQNGRGFQGVTGSALHSGLSLEGSQLSLSHQPAPQQGSHLHQYQQQQQLAQQQQQHQNSPTAQQHMQQQQHSYSQQQQSVNQLHHPQHVSHPLHQTHQQQPSNQPQVSHHQPTSIQHSQTSYHQQQQQNLQIQQHLHQRSLHQQRQQQKQQQQQQQSIQPKHILQNPSNVRAAQQHQQFGLKPEEPKPAAAAVVVINGQAGKEEGKKEKDENKEASCKPEKLDLEENDTTDKSCNQLDLANTKEKTPMCLINELARFNKMSHQYTLVDEQGPAHKKTFYVKLKLGEEEYSASGESIKKAQHAAAAIALAETKHPHPPPKPARHSGANLDLATLTFHPDTHSAAVVCLPDENITPTVELNALAMKRGEAAVYKAIEPQQPPYYPPPGMDYRGMYNHRYQQYNMRAGRDPRGSRSGGILWPMRYHYPRVSRAFYVSLRVGHREFIGDGPTRQAARHNAAQKALRVLKALPIPAEKKEKEVAEEVVEPETDDSLKSEISLVHEIALRRNMPVSFEVIREAGPPHMKNFITKCTVADKITEGEGTSKKSSKKRAAELMLELLQKLPPSPTQPFPRPKVKLQMSKKKNRNLIKSELQQQKADPNYGVGINPISRLIQIMQAQKKKEPVYALVSERGLPRRREFVMQVEVEDKSCTGTGPNKKLAKRSAAESMLQILGYTKPSPQPAKSSIKQSSSGEATPTNGDKKVKFLEISEDEPEENGPKCLNLDGASFQQKVPGLIHLPSHNNVTSGKPPHRSAATVPSQGKEAPINLSNILKPNLRPEIQLRELCKAMGYELEIDDFTKKRPYGTEHITRITVGSDPGQSFHGSNTTLESSRDQASMDALKVLLVKVKDIHPAGDGPQVKSRTSINTKKDISK